MARVKLICSFLTTIICGTNSVKYVSYNSSDLSYLSNGIQFPVPSNNEVIQLQPVQEEHLLPVMEWFGKLYNHHYWKKSVSMVTNELCRSHLSEYLAALSNGTSWASKMYDASGRYNGQFLFGNDFWTGSILLCKELIDNEINNEVPPFDVNFFMAKVRVNINEDLTPVVSQKIIESNVGETRQLNIAQCLPKSCKPEDVRLIMLEERSQAISLNIIDVRSVPGNYCLLNDVKFYIVGGSFVLIYGLIIIATLFHLTTSNFRTQNEDSTINNNNVENGKDKSSTKEKKGKLGELLLCFCFTTNAKKILNVDRLSDDSIKCIHGLRFFSIAWIIMVHTYLEVFAVADNKTFRIVTERSFLYQTVSNATFSVDTFFYISGLLVTILYFRTAQKKKQLQPAEKENINKPLLNYLILTAYRLLRLTPAYLFVLGVNEVVLRYSHSNSIFSPAMIDHITCSTYWWRNALYINNFFPQTEFCMLWSWYIANDTQFYLLAILILAFAVRNNFYFKWAAASVIIFLVISWITTFIIAMQYNYVARVEEPFALFDQLYDKPWLRIGPYLIGMATGYMLFRLDGRMKLSYYLVACGWIVAMTILLSLVYGLGRGQLTTPLSALYATFGHSAWGLALAWITVACCWGYAGPINSFLSFRGFLPLSRLTYCAYLIHPVLMVFISFKMDGPIHIQNYLVLIIFLGNLVTSFILSFIISVAFETPVVQLLKIILMTSSKEKSKN